MMNLKSSIGQSVLALAFLGVVFLLEPLFAEPRVDLEKDVLALRAEVNDLKRQIRHVMVPYNLREHLEWNPDDPMSVDRMKLALRGNFVNHGGILRVMIGSTVTEVHKGGFVTFEPPAWTPIDVPR